MDVKDYRKRIEQRLAQESSSAKSYSDLLDESTSPAERVKGLSEAVGPRAEADLAGAFAVVRNTSEHDDVRVAALASIATAAREREDLLDFLLRLLQDRDQAVVLRRAALTLLLQLRFNSAVLNRKRADFISALRTIVDDPDYQLRSDALETLAQEKDEYVQRRLMDSLTNEGPRLVEPEKAIQLLGYDIHAEQYPFLREVVRQSPSAAVKREAVRLLSADPTSKDLLVDMFRDRAENDEVRRASATALLSLAPEEFETYAREVVLDEQESDSVRAACLSAFGHFANPTERANDGPLNEYLLDLHGESASGPLEKAVRDYKMKYRVE